MLIGDELICLVIPAHREHWVLISRMTRLLLYPYSTDSNRLASYLNHFHHMAPFNPDPHQDE